jgi:hypothetical protein
MHWNKVARQITPLREFVDFMSSANVEMTERNDGSA